MIKASIQIEAEYDETLEHSVAVRDALELSIQDAIKDRDLLLGPAQWAMSVRCGVSQPLSAETQSNTTKLWANRLAAADAFFESSDLLGYQVVDADGWEHYSGGETASRIVFVEYGDNEDPECSLSMRLTITFAAGSDKIESATLNGDSVL